MAHVKRNSKIKIVFFSLLFTILLCSNFELLNGAFLQSSLENYLRLLDLGKSIATSLISSEPGSLVRASNIAVVGQSHFSDELKGHLIIYTFDNTELNIESDLLFQIKKMNTVACDIAKGDVDGDNYIEMIVTGYAWENNDIIAWLQIYEWDNQTLTLVDTATWYGFLDDSPFGTSLSVKIKDLNGDGVKEIVTCGSTGVEGKVNSELVVWGFNSKLHKLDAINWNHGQGEWSSAEDVTLGCLNEEIKIVTGGYCSDAMGTAMADLNVLSFTNQITLNDNKNWGSVGDTAVLGIFVQNNTVFTAGFSNDGTHNQGQVTKWNLENLARKSSVEWFTVSDTIANDLCVADIDNDDIVDIVTGGWANNATTELSQLRVWNLDLTLKDSEEWYTNNDSGIFAVHLENVDDDNRLEILTAGYTDNYSSKEVTIWEYPNNADPQLGIRHVDSDHISTTVPIFQTEVIILILVTILTAGALIGVYLYKRKN